MILVSEGRIQCRVVGDMSMEASPHQYPCRNQPLHFVAILVFRASALGIGNITMSVDIPLAHPGDNVTISYVVHNFEIGEFVRLEKMFDDKEPVILSTNHIMEKPFDKIERYSIVLDKEVSNTEDGTYKFIFTLTGIKEEDSGVYQVIGTDTKHKAIATVNVIREAKEIELFFGQPKQEAKVTDGQEFEFEEEQHQGMRCVVSGSNPAADVTVLRGDVDITDQFQRTVSTESTPTEVTGLEIVSHTVTLEAESVLVDYTFSRKPLKCVGKVQGSETALSQSITVKFQGFVYGQFAATVQLSKSHAEVGENLKVTCEVTNEDKGTFFIVWIKKLGTEEFEIGTNNHINADFKKTKKFDSKYQLGDGGDLSRVEFTLDITGVDSSDNGEIGCKIPSQGIEVFKRFTVNVPIQTVKMTSTDVNGTHAVAYVDGQEVMFKEGEIRQWVCRVNGSYPKPKVVVKAGDLDISDRFVKKEELKKSGVIPGLQNVYYEVMMTAKNLSIEYEFNNLTLECEASLPNVDSMSQGIHVSLSGYKPKFMCSESLVTSVHNVNVNIVCTVRADPPVKDVKFTWSQVSPQDNATLESGQSKGHYTANIESGVDEFETKMVLTIDRVFSQHFRKYFFMAENDLGKVTHSIELQQDAKADQRSDGSFPRFSISLIALAIATLIGL